MKKIILLNLIFIVGFACQQKPQAVDVDAAKTSITVVLDDLQKAMSRLDVDGYMKHLSDDGLFCGTDESEFWDKSGLIAIMTQSFPDSIQSMNFPLDKREIRLSSDGKSAMAIEQYLKTDMFGPRLPMRIDYHLIDNNGIWIIDLMTMNFVPYNEDLPTIINALADSE